MKFLVGFFLLIFTGITPATAASSYPFTQGVVELINSRTTLGIHFKLAKGWHVYWKNSGDSDAAPKWKWKIQNAQISKELWPVPERIPFDGIVNFGYEREALFQFELIPDDEKKNIIADLKLEFFVCKIECIPYFTELRKEIPYSAQSGPINKLFSNFLYPETAPADLTWIIERKSNNTLITQLHLPGTLPQKLKNIEFFPEEGEHFKTTAPSISVDEIGYQVILALHDTSKANFNGSRFLIVTTDAKGGRSAFDVALTGAQGPHSALILLWALIGGIILIFMPRVFPGNSTKARGFLGLKKPTKPDGCRIKY
jgi:thiol:disulfide interchange protein DsbD